MVLYKDKIKIKFDRVVRKGSSFVIFLKMNQEILDKVKIDTNKKAKGKKAIDFMEYHERLGHPSEELIIKTAKSRGIKLNKKERLSVWPLRCLIFKRKAINKVTFTPV